MVKTIGNVEGEGFVTTAGVTIDSGIGLLGEIRQIALSISGALTKSQLQAKGWAICDGTTPASQGISSPTITTTPDLRTRFLRHSANETTGGTGGSETHNHIWAYTNENGFVYTYNINATGFLACQYNLEEGAEKIFKGTGNNVSYYTNKTDTKPPYYDICYFIKVK